MGNFFVVFPRYFSQYQILLCVIKLAEARMINKGVILVVFRLGENKKESR
jgi:hypothetical protein